MKCLPMLCLPMLCSSLLLCLPACGDKAAAASADAGKLLNQAAAAAKNLPALASATSTVTDLGKMLRGITDGATADKAKAELTSLVGTLKGQLGALGGITKVADGGGLGVLEGALDQIGKLMSNPEVTKAIGPVLEQLKGLLGGK